MPEFSKLNWLKRLSGADLTDGEFRVLVSIFNHTDERGRRCYAKQTTLAAETGKSDRQVRRIIPELVRKGWLTEVRKGTGRSGLASEFDLSTPETPDTHVRCSDSARAETPDTGVRYSEETPDISGQITGHLEQKHRTFPVETPDTHVLPSDPLSDPDIRSGSDSVVPMGDLSDPSGEASVIDDRQRRVSVETDPRSLRAEGERDRGEPSGSPDRAETGAGIGTTHSYAEPVVAPRRGGFFAHPPKVPAPTDYVIRWPTGKPLPQSGDPDYDPFASYVDELTGQPLIASGEIDDPFAYAPDLSNSTRGNTP
jgi:hypothetical protein